MDDVRRAIEMFLVANDVPEDVATDALVLAGGPFAPPSVLWEAARLVVDRAKRNAKTMPAAVIPTYAAAAPIMGQIAVAAGVDAAPLVEAMKAANARPGRFRYSKYASKTAGKQFTKTNGETDPLRT